MAFQRILASQHARLQAEIESCNRQLGWYDKPVSFIEMMALLMTEVVEAYEAIDVDGARKLADGRYEAYPQQASEFADCYIRLADDCSRLGLDLSTIVDTYQYGFVFVHRDGPDGVSMQLVKLVRDAIEAYRNHGLGDSVAPGYGVAGSVIAKCLAHFYLQLEETCAYYSVQLLKEVESKISVNLTRGYRHGNKFA